MEYRTARRFAGRACRVRFVWGRLYALDAPVIGPGRRTRRWPPWRLSPWSACCWRSWSLWRGSAG